jgi:pyruvate carboxylase
MATTTQTTDIPVTLRLSAQASAKLAARAAESGQDVASCASELIEQAITRPSIDEIMAPFRKQVAESGMSDEELDDFHRDLLAKVRAEMKAKSA